MVGAIVSQPIDEVTVLRVPKAWDQFPQEWQEQLGFWQVIRSLQMQDGVVMFGPPRDFHWIISRDPAVIRAVELRHDCTDCQDARTKAAELLESDSQDLVALVQFTQDYLYPIGSGPNEFAPVGTFHE